MSCEYGAQRFRSAVAGHHSPLTKADNPSRQATGRDRLLFFLTMIFAFCSHADVFAAGHALPAASKRPTERSVLAVKVDRAMGGKVVRLSTENFVITAPNEVLAARAAAVADRAYELTEKFLGRPGPIRGRCDSLLLFVVPSNVWKRTIVRSGLRRDSAAAQVGCEIYVLETSGVSEFTLRIAHEVAHQRVNFHYSRGLPLWLEEGLVGMIGWDIARAIRESSGWEIIATEKQKSSGDTQWTVNRLVSTVSYPDDPAEARGFEQACHAFVRALTERLGYAHWVEFVDEVYRAGAPWDEILREGFSFDENDFENLDTLIRHASEL